MLTKPRITGRQLHHSNPPSSSPEEYYRISLYDEFLSHIVAELGERFVNNQSHSIAVGLLHLVPSVNDEVGIPEELTRVVDLYKDDLPYAIMFTTEYSLWVRKHKECVSAVPEKLIGALQECSTLLIPIKMSCFNTFTHIV